MATKTDRDRKIDELLCVYTAIKLILILGIVILVLDVIINLLLGNTLYSMNLWGGFVISAALIFFVGVLLVAHR